MTPNYKKIIIHCSASDNRKYDYRLICKDHIRRGFIDIGYHFGIDADGKLEILRDISKIGAHCKGHNEDSIGIVLLGLHNFNDSQFSTLADVISMLMHLFNIRPDEIYGHKEFTKEKTCPNFDIEEWKITYLEKRLVARTYCDR